MSVSRATLLTLTEELGDFVGAPRWGDTLKLQALTAAHWREWRGLLAVNRLLRVAQRTVTTDANGRFTKAALNSGSGDSTETAHRVLAVADGVQYLTAVRFEDYPSPSGEASLPQAWYEFGDEVQVVPATSGRSLTVTVNHLPCRVSLLTDDNSSVVFPDSFEMIVAFEAAADLLMKGGAETRESQELRQQAEYLRGEMYQTVKRLGTGPQRMAYADSADQWGGQ